MTESVAIDTWKECTQENKEFRGADISSSVGISNVEECVAYCQTVEGCVGVTYTKSSSTCTAKDKRTGDSIQPNNNAVSVSMMCLSKYLGLYWYIDKEHNFDPYSLKLCLLMPRGWF